MGKIISSAEIFSIFFLLVILRGLHRNGKGETRKIRLFRTLVWATIFSLICDSMSYIGPSWQWLLFIVNILSYVMTAVIMVLFGYYAYELICEKTSLSIWYARANMLVNVVAFALIIIGSINGKLFFFREGEFFFGPWVEVVCILQIICIIYLCILVISYSSKLGRREAITLCFYFLPPVMAVTVEMLKPEYSFSTPSSAVSMQIIYVMLVSGEVESSKAREKLLEDMAYIDLLTGLNNRRPFTERLENLPADSLAGVIYCDVNGLKETNDCYGHAAGDRLLLRFTSILKSYFHAEEIYRISGDEFVVLTTSCSREAFSGLADALSARIKAQGDIASIGTAFGNSVTVRSLVEESEKKMYASKRAYYERADHDRRTHSG